MCSILEQHTFLQRHSGPKLMCSNLCILELQHNGSAHGHSSPGPVCVHSYFFQVCGACTPLRARDTDGAHLPKARYRLRLYSTVLEKIHFLEADHSSVPSICCSFHSSSHKTPILKKVANGPSELVILGYGSWNSGTNRGYEDYNYGYGYSQDNSGNYGYDAYESYDSRSSMNDRDLYRSGYDYCDAEHNADNAYEGHYDNSYGNRRDQYHSRAWDNFGHRGQNWGRDRRNHRPMQPGYSGRRGGQWHDPPVPMGGRGHGPNRPPPLFSHKLFPDYKMFQELRGFSGNMRFGGGSMKQRIRRNWKMWDADFKKKRIKNEPIAGKRKQANNSDEPDSKAAKTDGSDNSDSDNEEGPEGEAAEKDSKNEGEVEGAEDEERKGDSEKGALTIQEEISQIKRKLQAGKKTQERQKKRYRDRMVERIQFVCSLCKYRTFYEDEMSNHLESKFHKEHFLFVGTKLPQQTAEFLQEYVTNKTKKTEERRKAIEDINAVIQQIYKDQDVTQDVGMEHFIKKVEAAHCVACDLFIPMQYGIIQKHLKSIDHNHNRRAMMEQSKKSSLVVARSILNNKFISKKLDQYLKGENPFTDDPEEKEEHEEGEAGTSGNMVEGATEEEGNKAEEEAKSGNSVAEENPVEEGNEKNKEEGRKEPAGQMEEWNTSQEAAPAVEHEDEDRKEIIPSEEMEPPDE